MHVPCPRRNGAPWRRSWHAMERLAEAERLLTVAREAPERRQNAAALRGQAAIVESLHDLGPLARELRDLMLAVNFSVADSLPAGGTHEFRRLFGLIDELSAHLKADACGLWLTICANMRHEWKMDLPAGILVRPSNNLSVTV